MAVLGVVETVPNNASVTVRVRGKQLASTINNNFVNADGKPARGRECWTRLVEMRDAKQIQLHAAEAAPRDLTMATLAEDVTKAAQERFNEIGEEEAVANAIGPKPGKRRRKKRLFPPIETTRR
jgi:hypothetical protein